MKSVPFLDLVTPHRELKAELLSVLEQAIDTAGFVGGRMVQTFEEEFAAFCGTGSCVAVNSGTDALRFAYLAGGIKPGDEVITVPNTFIATTEAITQAGGQVVFVDVDERTFTMDPARLRDFLESRCERTSAPASSASLPPVTRDRLTGRPVAAVVPVHLYGQMADMDAIREIAAAWNLTVFEDACQAHGAEYFSHNQNRWLRAGSMGAAGAFSFYPGKNLGALGEGGAITTNDPEIARKCRMLRDHGQAKKYYHDLEGYNGRLDAIQCGFLSVKLRRLSAWNHARRQAAAAYNRLLGSLPDVVTPFEPEWSRAVYHLYVVRVKDRDRVQKRLADQGIATALHYPVPLHRQKAYEHHRLPGDGFPVAARAADEILSLPMFPGLREEEILAVAAALTGGIEPDAAAVPAGRAAVLEPNG